MPALGTFVTSVTQDRFIPKVVDNFLLGNVLLARLMANQRPWRGGDPIKQPVNLEKYLQLGSYFGFDSLSTTHQNTRQVAQWDPSQEYVSISLSGIQKAVNQGDAAVLNLLGVEMEQRGKDLRDEMARQLYLDGTGNSDKDILGLQAAVDDSTSVTTYANLSRSTYTKWKATRTAQSGSLALSDLAADFDAAQIGDDAPDLIVTTPAVWTIYEALLTPTVAHNAGVREFRLTAKGARPIDNISGNQGFRALAFRGIPMVADEQCTSQNIYTLNLKHLKMYRLPQPTGFTVESEREGFGWTGWLQGINADAVTGRLQWYGQLLCDSPRTQARRTGVSS